MITGTSQFLPDEIVTQDYTPGWYYGNYFWEQRKPPFIKRFIPAILRDSRIRFAMKLLKGPLQADARFNVEGDSLDLVEYVDRQIKTFWKTSAAVALRAVEWGHSGSEAVYREKNGVVHFHKLLHLSPWDIRLWTVGGEKAAIRLRDAKDSKDGYLWLHGPKGFWHIHDRQEERWYGVSRLLGAYPAWYDKHKNGGARDALNLFFYKYALNGEVIYYPPQVRKLPDGSIMDPKEKAEQIANQRRSGATILLPNETDDKGNQMWRVEYSTNTSTGTELMDYDKSLDGKMFEGMGIPGELIEAGETGSGYAGRRVPAQVFFSILQELGDMLLFDLDEQIIRPLVDYNFGEEAEYSVEMLPLASSDLEQDPAANSSESMGPNVTEGDNPIGPPQTNSYQ